MLRQHEPFAIGVAVLRNFRVICGEASTVADEIGAGEIGEDAPGRPSSAHA